MVPFKKSALFICVLAVLLVAGYRSFAQDTINQPVPDSNWVKPYPPFRIAGNLYYVGTYELGCYLITTTQGHILINTGLESSVPQIRAAIEKLGFKFSDIKILLDTHAHYDHVGGMADIKRLTGARLMVEKDDGPVMADGGNSDFLFGGKGPLFKSVKPDQLLNDHDTVKLGDMNIMVLHHPGHTRGASSFLFDVKDSLRTWRVLIANMPSVLNETKLSGMPTYPNVGDDYAYTLKAMRNIKFDIWLASHASQFNLADKHKSGDAYNPAAFADQKGYDTELDDLTKAYLKKLKE
jgi:metallo-beta-lactamase class B